MKRRHSQGRFFCSGLLLLAVACLGGLPGRAQQPPAPPDPPLAVQVADRAERTSANIVVRNAYLSCFAGSPRDWDVVLSTVGAEYEQASETRFMPVLSLAFDRELGDGENLEWMALWNLGKQRTGFWSNLRAVFPFNRRQSSPGWQPPAKKARRLEQLQKGEADGKKLKAQAPDLDAVNLWKPSYTPLVTSALRSALGWADAYSPAQFLYRTWLFRRRDLRDRRFQQTYQGLTWYLDAVDSSGLAVPRETLAAVKFHLIRNRSTFGPWVAEEGFLESAWGYDSHWRQRTLSVSATLMIAANEYGLGYEELYQPVVNGTATPVGGLLYYDPAVAPAASQARWDSPNLFDLGYNPWTDPRVQKLAREHPGERIPLGLYSHYAVLPRKPILLVDFFNPGNARRREAAAVRMNLLREAMGLGAPRLVYWGVYKPTTYIANKKAFTPLANRVPALGLEDFRLLLRARLLFEPELADTLLREVDKRELNPLMPAGATEQLNAQIQYETLRGQEGAEACRQVGAVRQQLYRQFSGRQAEALDAAQRAELRGWLEQQRALIQLSRLAASDQIWEELWEEAAAPLAVLESVELAPRLPTRKVLLNFERRLLDEQQRMGSPAPAELAQAPLQIEALLARAYAAQGRPPDELARDLGNLQRKLAAERRHQEARRAEKQRKQFEARLQQSLEWLARLDGKKDLEVVPPWRVEGAVEFLTEAPEAVRRNGGLEPVLARYRLRVEQALTRTEALLSRRRFEEEEIETARLRCLARLAQARREKLLATTEPKKNGPPRAGNQTD